METDGEGGGGGEAGRTGSSELGRLLETIESSEWFLQGLEVAVGEGWEEAALEECVLNTTDNAFPTLETMVAEVEPAPAVGMRRGAMCSLAPVLSPPPQDVSRRCTHCASEKVSKWPDDPGTLCNACGQRLLQTNSSHCGGSRSSRMENSASGNDVAVLVEALPCGLDDASLDAFFDQMVSEVSWEEAGPGRAEEEELEWLLDAFPSVETMALEVEVEEPWALETPWARTNGQRHVTAMETTCRQANVPRAKKETTAMQPVLPQRRRSRCMHCATENTPEWRQGPEGPCTLCNACGIVFRKKGRLLAEYRPANSPAFSPLLHSSTYARALKMHLQNETSAIGEMHVKLMGPPPPAKGPTSSVRPRPPRRRPRPRQCGGDRRCTRCATEKTPQWREGPEGPRTLCNTCGLVFKKKGRLLPEYRPANSPVCSPLLHSNKYTRALEMDRQNETTSAACHGEVHSVPMEGQLLLAANGPTSSSPLPPCLVLGEEAFAVIGATAEARRAERGAAFLAAMDN